MAFSTKRMRASSIRLGMLRVNSALFRPARMTQLEATLFIRTAHDYNSKQTSNCAQGAQVSFAPQHLLPQKQNISKTNYLVFGRITKKRKQNQILNEN